MKYGSYAALEYLIPCIAFVVPFIVTLVVALIQCCLVRCDDKPDDAVETHTARRPSYSQRFFMLHLKSARLLLGKVVRLRRKDHVIILHGYPFRGVFPPIYIFLSECLIAGTISAFAASTLLFHDSHSCDASKSSLDCFFVNTSSWGADPINCGKFLQSAENGSDLICHEITVNLGAALGITGGLMSLSPVLFSFITSSILYLARSDVYIKALLGVAQALTYAVGIAIIVVIAVFHTDLIRSNIGIQICVGILLSITLFCMPWCLLEKDSDTIYVGNNEDLLTKSGESYVDVQSDDERTPINRQSKKKKKLPKWGLSWGSI